MFRRRFKYLPNLIRLGFFCLIVSCGLLFFTIRAVARNVDEGMLSLGHQMMRYVDQRAMGEVRHMFLNGARIEFATGTTNDPVSTVLDYYQRRCAEHDGSIREQLAEIAQSTQRNGRAQREEPTPNISLNTLRAGSENQGFVACLDLGNARLTPSEILQRLESFARTGNLTDVGRMRYLYAERSASGRTRFIGFWSDSELNIQRMFPTSGDAPGEDLPDVPRAPGLRRLLHAFEEGQRYAMTIHAGTTSKQQVEQHFRREMPRHGWTFIPMHGGTPDLQGQTMLTYERGSTTVSLIIGTGADGQTSVTTLMGGT